MTGEDRPAPLGSDAFFEQVYDELRAIAHSRMQKERRGQTLQSTELVHEAYLRLSRGDAAWQNRGHFFAAAAEAMRRILVERARARRRVKRGGEAGKPPRRIPLDLPAVAELADDRDPEAVLVLDRAIERLSRHDDRAAQVVKLRFYAGLSVDEVAEALGTSKRTVLRDWEFARAWLYSESGG